VVVPGIDRLARSSRDLHNLLHEMESLSVGFRSLGEAWCDTTTDVGRLMMTIMGGIAEFERSLIRSRTDAGIERARRQGKKFGRPERLDEGQKRVIADRYGKGATIPELARSTALGSARSGGHSACEGALMWFFLQSLIVFAVVGSNFHWHWTPNHYLPSLIGFGIAFVVTGAINELWAWLRR
jgi:Resolvase, N terminal domain